MKNLLSSPFFYIFSLRKPKVTIFELTLVEVFPFPAVLRTLPSTLVSDVDTGSCRGDRPTSTPISTAGRRTFRTRVVRSNDGESPSLKGGQ